MQNKSKMISYLFQEVESFWTYLIIIIKPDKALQNGSVPDNDTK